MIWLLSLLFLGTPVACAISWRNGNRRAKMPWRVEMRDFANGAHSIHIRHQGTWHTAWRWISKQKNECFTNYCEARSLAESFSSWPVYETWQNEQRQPPGEKKDGFPIVIHGGES